jgi:hypothetical protein
MTSPHPQYASGVSANRLPTNTPQNGEKFAICAGVRVAAAPLRTEMISFQPALQGMLDDPLAETTIYEMERRGDFPCAST